jgi:hypothetical protein
MQKHTQTYGSKISAVSLWLLLALLSPPALAITDEIQVYTDDINKPGEFGLELHLNTTPTGRKTPDYPGESPPHHGLRLTPEFSYGINKDWEAGLYLPTVREASGNFSVSGVKLRLKWMPLKGDEETGGWYLGANVELSSVSRKYSESRLGSELRIMSGYRAQKWHIAVNPIFGWDLSRGYRGGGPSFDFATKAVHDVTEGIAMGVEYYTGLGKLSNTLPGPLQEKTLYLVMDYDRKPWAFNIGAGKGLNGATDKWTVKTIIEVPFK